MMPPSSSSSSSSEPCFFSSLSPLVKQDLARLDCGDLDTRRIAMAALKGYVGRLDRKTMPFFLDQVSDYDEASRPYAISLFVEVARVHRAAVAPFIPRILCSVMHSLRTTGGAAPQQHLQRACAEVVAALAAHVVGNDAVVLAQICHPLLGALRSRLEPLAAGVAACLQALVESSNWGALAPPELRDDLCRRSIAALADKGTRTLPHLRLAQALSCLHPDATVGRYGASLLSSTSLILHPDSPSSWQQRSIAAQLINAVLQSSPSKPPPPHELDAAVHALAIWRHDRVPAVRNAVSNALKSIDSPLSYTPTSSSSSSSSTPHSSKNQGRRRDNNCKPLSFASTPLSSPLPNATFAITPSVSGMSHSPLLSVRSARSSISLSRFSLPHVSPDQVDPESNGLFAQASLADEYFLCGGGLSGNLLTQEEEETLGLGDRVDFSLRFDSGGQSYFDQSPKDGASYCGSTSDPLKEEDTEKSRLLGLSNRVEFSLTFDSVDQGCFDQSSKDGASYCGSNDPSKEDEEVDFLRRGVTTQDKVDFSLRFDSGNWGYFDHCSKGEEGPPEVSMSNGLSYRVSGDPKGNKEEAGFPTGDLDANNKSSPLRRHSLILQAFDKGTPSKEEDDSTQCSSISYTLSGVASLEYNISPQKVKARMSPEDFILFTTPRRLVRSLQSNSSTPGSTITLDCNSTIDGDEDDGEAANMVDTSTISSRKSELGWRGENNPYAEGETIPEPLSLSPKMAVAEEAANMVNAAGTIASSEKGESGRRRENHPCVEGDAIPGSFSLSVKVAASPSTGSCISENSDAEDRAPTCESSSDAGGPSSNPPSPTSRGTAKPQAPRYSHTAEESEEKGMMAKPPLMKLGHLLLYKGLRRVHHCAEMFLHVALCSILAFFLITVFFKSQQQEYHHHAMVPT